MIIPTVSYVAERWRQWLQDNPDADSHQRYYAAGVIDALKFAETGEPFAPDWKQTLTELSE